MRKHLSSASRLAAAVGLAAGLAATSAAARAPLDLDLTYVLSVTGLKIGQVDISVELDDAGYRGAARAETTGLAGWFAQALANTKSQGAVDASGKVAPESFNLVAETAKKTLTVDIAYEGDAPAKVTSDPAFRPKSYEADPAEQHGALDPVSAIVASIVSTSADGGCGRTIPVFDGRRRYDVVLGAPTGEGELEGTPYVECSATVKRVAGYKAKAMEKPDLTFTARFSTNDDGITRPLQAWSDLTVGYVALTLAQ